MLIDYRENTAGLEQGLHDIPFEKYITLPALNVHSIQDMRKSAAHFYWARTQPQTPPTPAMIVGQCFDLALTDPEAFKDKVIPDIGWNKNSLIWKSWKAEQDAAGRISLPTKGDATTIAHINKMVENVKRKEASAALLAKGYPQKTLIWFDPIYRLWCKARPDWLIPTGGPAIVVDIKKAADASFWGFTNQARRLGYYWQAYFYLRGMTVVTGVEHERFYFLVCEATGPLESQVFKPTVAQLDDAGAKVDVAVGKIIRCLDSGEWPGYPDYIMDMDTGQEAWDGVQEAEYEEEIDETF